jgi:hypothetical protein
LDLVAFDSSQPRHCEERYAGRRSPSSRVLLGRELHNNTQRLFHQLGINGLDDPGVSADHNLLAHFEGFFPVEAACRHDNIRTT